MEDKLEIATRLLVSWGLPETLKHQQYQAREISTYGVKSIEHVPVMTDADKICRLTARLAIKMATALIEESNASR